MDFLRFREILYVTWIGHTQYGYYFFEINNIKIINENTSEQLL